MNLRFIFRAGTLLTLIALFILSSSIGKFFFRDPVKKRVFQTGNVSRFCRLALFFLNISVEVEGRDYLSSSNKGTLVISNHLSFVDIVVLASLKNFVFITSVEVQQSPIQGFLSDLGGSFFVERRSTIGLRKEILEISQMIKNGFRVLFFPEGTSSDGRGVLPFKNAFFTTAIRNSAPVLSMCINYTKANGKQFTDEYRDQVFYYGDLTFLGQLKQTLKLKSLAVHVKVFPSSFANGKRNEEDTSREDLPKCFGSVCSDLI